MPNKKAAFKSIRQTRKRHIRNKAQLTELRGLMKRTGSLILSNNREEADTALRTLESKLDRAVKKHAIKKNNASRHISRLRHQWAKIGSK